MLVEADMDEVKGVIDEPIRRIPPQDQQTVIRELRDLPPAHFLFKIENFSALSSNSVADKYESSDFEVGGYKWKLSLYPKGNKKVNEDKHISLYLVLSKSNSFTLHQEVNVYFKLFLYNQMQDKYLTVQDPKKEVRRFRGVKTEWGFDQFVPLSVFNDASSGYLIDDCCIFGAEVFVLDPIKKGECVSVVKNLVSNNTYTRNVQKFAQLTAEYYYSREFIIGGYRWTLCFYPKGCAEENLKSLSVYLCLEDTVKPGERLYVEFVARVRDQLHGRHHEESASHYFSASSESCDLPRLIPLSKLNDTSLGYVTNGAVILEVEILLMTHLKEFY